MNHPTKRRRALTAEELRIAERIRTIISATDGLTEGIVAEVVGVSPGQISHWSSGRLAVPARRAPALAKALGIDDPGELSVEYRAQRDQHRKSARGVTLISDSSMEELVALRAEVDALRALVVTTLTVGASHRPIEAADVARRIRRHVHPAIARQPTAAEVLDAIDKLVVRAESPARGGAAKR